MSSDVFLSESQLQRLMQLLKNYNGSILRVELVKQQLKLTYLQVRDLLTELACNDLLEMNYKVWVENPIVEREEVFKTYREALNYIKDSKEHGEQVSEKISVAFRVKIDV